MNPRETHQLKRTPRLPKIPWNRKPRKGLRQVSDRRKRELREYAERRKSFLAMPENKWCVVSVSGLIGSRLLRTTDIHHRAGREGKLLNEEKWWLAVSRKGHDWIHANPNEARRNGWLI